MSLSNLYYPVIDKLKRYPFFKKRFKSS
jgi:hypothetical protein